MIGKEILCGLLELFQQATMIASLIDRSLQLVAQLSETFETLLVRQVLV